MRREKEMKADRIAHTKRALGAILNVVRHKPVLTVEEASARLELIDQIALAALTNVEEFLPVVGSSLQSSTWRSSEPPRVSGQSRGLRPRSVTRLGKKQKLIGDQTRRKHVSAS